MQLKVAIQMSSTEWKTDYHSFIIKSFLMQPCSFCGPRCEEQLVGWACVGGQLCLARIHTRGNCNEKVHYLREHTVSMGWYHTLPHRATRWASTFQTNDYIKCSSSTNSTCPRAGMVQAADKTNWGTQNGISCINWIIYIYFTYRCTFCVWVIKLDIHR